MQKKLTVSASIGSNFGHVIEGSLACQPPYGVAVPRKKSLNGAASLLTVAITIKTVTAVAAKQGPLSLPMQASSPEHSLYFTTAKKFLRLVAV